MSHVLTLITFIPIAGMVLVLALPDSMKPAFKWIAVVATALQLGIAVYLYKNFDTTTSAVQFAEKASWMPAYHISYFIGADGISISMILLTALIMFISVFASFGINRAEKGYYAMLLMLDTGMMGVFVSLDFFLFYIFWEVMLLPMYFLIGIWGGPRREYAAIKFFLYTLLGSVLILLAMLGLYYYGATPTFDLTELAANSSHYSMHFQEIAWIALFIGFRDQNSCVPVPYLAARRARRSAYGHLGDSRRRAAENGHLRHSARQLCGAPCCELPACVDIPRGDRHDQYSIRRDVRDGAD